ncbi:MAG: solute:sodium symporter family transporter, partial [Planctomycetaceae bacterium]|nr:solute:sodium symporter family transporter [Planctomycetaceae bacterium]
GLVFACTVGLMLVIGQISPSPEPYVQKDVNVVDMTPWKPAWYIGIALVAIVLTIYIALADFSVVFGG